MEPTVQADAATDGEVRRGANSTVAKLITESHETSAQSTTSERGEFSTDV